MESISGFLERIASALERQCEQHDASVERNKVLRDENIRLRLEDVARVNAQHEQAIAQIDVVCRRIETLERRNAVAAVDPQADGTGTPATREKAD